MEMSVDDVFGALSSHSAAVMNLVRENEATERTDLTTFDNLSETNNESNMWILN